MSLLDRLDTLSNKLQLPSGTRLVKESNKWKVDRSLISIGKDPINKNVEDIVVDDNEGMHNHPYLLCFLNFGTMPNNSTKTISIPSVVLSAWDRHTAHIDYSRSFTYNPTNNFTWPLSCFIRGISSSYYVYSAMRNNDILVRTQGVLSDATGVSWNRFTQTTIVLRYKELLQ